MNEDRVKIYKDRWMLRPNPWKTRTKPKVPKFVRCQGVAKFVQHRGNPRNDKVQDQRKYRI